MRRVALVYDRVNKWGGAERVLLALHEIWPKAPLYTAVYNPQSAPWAKKFKVIPSFLNKIPLAKAHHEILAPLMPLAFESFDFSEYDVVISVTSEAAKAIITKPETLHLCYCLTPTRYLWSGEKDYFKNESIHFLAKPVLAYLKNWDMVASQRPDVYLAISRNVQKRIKKYYQREAEVLYPSVDTKTFKPLAPQNPREKYFLLVSRLVGYKRIDIVVKAFNYLGLPLKIIGTGNQLGKLRKMAKTNVQFLGQLTDKETLGYYQRCQAVVFPQEEDFGLVPLEAQACGRPVIAYRGGGALETVVQGVTGLFFYPQRAKALAKVVKSFRPESFKPTACRQNAENFSQERFKKKFRDFVLREWKKKS